MPQLNSHAAIRPLRAFVRRQLNMMIDRVSTPAASPGARQLLAEAEASAERGLHLARGVLWVVVGVIFFVLFGFARLLPWAPAVTLFLALAVTVPAWIWIWRLIVPGKRSALKYALIALDGWVIARPAIYLALVPSFGPSFGRLGLALNDYLTAAPTLLVYLALSGGFRIDPWAALFSTAVALAGFVAVAASTALPVRQALATGAVIAFAGILGAYVARVLRQVALKARQEEILERYVPEVLTRELARTGEPEGAGRVEEVTILMADIRGFTRATEHLPPAEAVALLNEYFAAVVTPLVAEGAFLDAYIGDGLLAHFEGDDRGRRALRASQGMHAALDGFNAGRAECAALRMGIAIHAGPVLVGTVGAPARRAYTLIGDAVNVTDRLEKCNKDLDSVVVASVGALCDINELGTFGFRGPHLVALRGHDEPIMVHYLPSTR